MYVLSVPDMPVIIRSISEIASGRRSLPGTTSRYYFWFPIGPLDNLRLHATSAGRYQNEEILSIRHSGTACAGSGTKEVRDRRRQCLPVCEFVFAVFWIEIVIAQHDMPDNLGLRIIIAPAANGARDQRFGIEREPGAHLHLDDVLVRLLEAVLECRTQANRIQQVLPGSKLLSLACQEHFERLRVATLVNRGGGILGNRAGPDFVPRQIEAPVHLSWGRGQPHGAVLKGQKP